MCESQVQPLYFLLTPLLNDGREKIVNLAFYFCIMLSGLCRVYATINTSSKTVYQAHITLVGILAGYKNPNET